MPPLYFLPFRSFLVSHYLLTDISAHMCFPTMHLLMNSPLQSKLSICMWNSIVACSNEQKCQSQLLWSQVHRQFLDIIMRSLNQNLSRWLYNVSKLTNASQKKKKKKKLGSKLAVDKILGTIPIRFHFLNVQLCFPFSRKKAGLVVAACVKHEQGAFLRCKGFLPHDFSPLLFSPDGDWSCITHFLQFLERIFYEDTQTY